MEKEYTSEYERYELCHWWFVARRKILHAALDQIVPLLDHPRWLDIGCGTGVLLDSYPRIQNKVGVEVDAACVDRAREKGLEIFHIPAADWDFHWIGRFSLVTVCDVLEHVEHDEAAVAELHRRLEPGGVALVTVPALRSLWSDHDITNHHFRRYHLPQLLSLFDERRWEVLRTSYFCSLLLPPIWLTRKVKNFRRRIFRGTRPPVGHDFRFGPRLVDRSLESIFSLERYWLRRGKRFPAGSSLMIVVRKRAEGPDDDAAAPGTASAVPGDPLAAHEGVTSGG